MGAEGPIFAPGHADDGGKQKNGSGTCIKKLRHWTLPCCKKRIELIGVSDKGSDQPPAYSSHASSGFPGYSYGGAHDIGSMFDGKDGSFTFNRGVQQSAWANASITMSPDKFFGLSPHHQNNMMAFGSNPKHDYKAEVPDPPKDEECKGASCPETPKFMDDIRTITDKENKKNSKPMCWECCHREFGTDRARRVWLKAK